jgi:hypothetical protein
MDDVITKTPTAPAPSITNPTASTTTTPTTTTSATQQVAGASGGFSTPATTTATTSPSPITIPTSTVTPTPSPPPSATSPLPPESSIAQNVSGLRFGISPNGEPSTNPYDWIGFVYINGQYVQVSGTLAATPALTATETTPGNLGTSQEALNQVYGSVYNQLEQPVKSSSPTGTFGTDIYGNQIPITTLYGFYQSGQGGNPITAASNPGGAASFQPGYYIINGKWLPLIEAGYLVWR